MLKYLIEYRQFFKQLIAVSFSIIALIELSPAMVFAQPITVPAEVTAQAAKEGLVWVMVNLKIHVSLGDLKTKGKEKEIKEMEQALLAYLNLKAEDVGFNSNGAGQVNLLLSPDGLARLATAESLVKAVFADSMGGGNGDRSVSNNDGRLEAIKAEILRQGTAPVRLYRYDSDPQEMDIDLKQFYLLKESKDVRALHLVGWNPTGTVVDPAALAAAKATGYADVIVALHPPLNYNAMIGEDRKAVWEAQAREIHRLFETVLPNTALEEHTGFPTAHAPKLPLALLENPPAGIAKIELNRMMSLN